MPRRVLIAPEAGRGFRAARVRFKHPGAGPAAARSLQALLDAPRTLQDHPHAGKLSDEHAGVFQLVVSGYRVMYLIGESGDVEIVAVLAPGLP